jgi:hypothetical protein
MIRRPFVSVPLDDCDGAAEPPVRIELTTFRLQGGVDPSTAICVCPRVLSLNAGLLPLNCDVDPGASDAIWACP